MESYGRICNCHAWRKFHLLPTYCKLTLWPASPFAWEQTLPSALPSPCNSIITQLFVKVSQAGCPGQGRQHIPHTHGDSPSQAHVQPHGKALRWPLAEPRAAAAPPGAAHHWACSWTFRLTQAFLSEQQCWHIKKKNEQIEFLLGCWKHSTFTSPRGTWN